MSVYVVDASVVAKWFSDEVHYGAARRTLNGPELHAPDFLLLEMDSVVGKWARRGLIDTTEAARVREELRAVPMTLYRLLPLLDAAWAISQKTQQSVYDCLYLALAVALDEQVVTADRRFHDAVAAAPFRRHVLWVEDLPQ